MFFHLVVFLCSIWTCYANDLLVFGIGTSPIDLLVQVDEDFIRNHTTRMANTSQVDTGMIQRCICESRQPAKMVPGGSAANTIRALTKLGEKCAFFGAVGEDSYGEKFCRNLVDHGVISRVFRNPNISTCHVLCMVAPNGERMFLGVNPSIREVEIDRRDIEQAKWLHVEGRLFEDGDPLAVMNMLELAKSAHVGISLALSCNIVQKHKQILTKALSKYVDILFCNEDEIVELTELQPEEGCLKAQQFCPIAVVTLGNKGCYVASNNELLHVPALTANVIDTTGAGDFFAAGFLYGYLHKKPIETCAKIGHHLGRAIVEVMGAELSELKWVEIRKTLRQ